MGFQGYLQMLDTQLEIVAVAQLLGEILRSHSGQKKTWNKSKRTPKVMEVPYPPSNKEISPCEKGKSSTFLPVLLGKGSVRSQEGSKHHRFHQYLNQGAKGSNFASSASGITAGT